MMILEELDTEFGPIRIVQSKSDGSCTYFQGDAFHSQANAEGVSTFPYVHVLYSIVRQAEAQNVLVIGCAGGTLATMLHRLGCRVTVVDINPHSFTLARKYFQMPEEIRCIVDDGCRYLCTTINHYDGIVIDVFDANGDIPAEFTTEDFFMSVKKVLQPFGIVAMNTLVEHDMDMLADRIALNMEPARIPAVLFDWPGRPDRNTIIAGGAVEHMQILLQRKPAFVRKRMRGIIRRRPKRWAVKGWK